MNTSVTLLPHLSSYQLALTVLILLCLLVLIQSFLTAPLAFLKGQQAPGMPLNGDHNMLSFRVLRTHANSVESLPAMGLLILLAVILGANPAWVNYTAAAHLLFRIAFWWVYYSGSGKVAGGPRTMCYVGGLIANFVLVFLCLYRIFTLQ